MEQQEFEIIIKSLESDEVTALKLENKALDKAQVVKLSAVLKGNKALHTLHLGFNQIGDSGAKALAEALKGNKTLHTLDLYGN